MDIAGIIVADDELASLARKWSIASLEAFGSVLRDDFSEHSDIDLLVTFKAGSTISALDLVQIREDLTDLFGRSVDLVEPDSIVNPYRREAIVGHSRRIYAA